MPALPYSITISDEERAYLKSLIKTRTIQAQVVDRARMLLWKSEAKTDKAIADGLGVSVNTVRRCIDRYLNSGIKELLINNHLQNMPNCVILCSNNSGDIGGKYGYKCRCFKT